MSASAKASLATNESKIGKRGNSASQANKTNHFPPINSPVDRISFLQRVVGNREVERLLKSEVLQDKLSSGQSSATSAFQPSVPALPTGPLIQTSLKTGEPNRSGNIALGEMATLPPIVEEVLHSPGQPLDPVTRAFMEPRFGHDFGHVRVHTDAKAAESAHAAEADAYTVGHDIVFSENKYAPANDVGRGLLAHELAHTIQQGNAGGALLSAEQHGIFEPSAVADGRDVSSGKAVSRNLPACGRQIQRAPASDLRWKNDVRAARYRGQLMANRIRKQGRLSREARAKINEELAYFEGDAKETYLREVQPILKATVEIEMPEARIIKKVPQPPPVTWSPVRPDPGQLSDEEIYATLIEAKRKEAEEEEAERQSDLEKLREMTKDWGTDQEFSLALLEPILKANLHPDPRGVAAAIRKQILARYEIWLRAEDKRRLALCGEMPGGVTGFILKQQAKWQPTLDPCRSWFQDEYSHGPQELLDLELKLKFRGKAHDAMHTVYWSMREYRYKTNPSDLKQAEMAGEMVSALAGLGRMPVSPPGRGSQPPNVPPPAPVPAKVSPSVSPPSKPPGRGPTPPAPVKGEPVPVEPAPPKPKAPSEPPKTPQKLLKSTPTGRITSEIDPRSAKLARRTKEEPKTVYEVKKADPAPDTQAEVRIAEHLDADGHSVHFNASTPDLTVDGVPTDVKHLNKKAGIPSAINNARKQASQVAIDGTTVGLTKDEAVAGVREFEAEAARPDRREKYRNIETVYILQGDGVVYVYHRTPPPLKVEKVGAGGTGLPR
jgi:hypothetical protein